MCHECVIINIMKKLLAIIVLGLLTSCSSGARYPILECSFGDLNMTYDLNEFHREAKNKNDDYKFFDQKNTYTLHKNINFDDGRTQLFVTEINKSTGSATIMGSAKYFLPTGKSAQMKAIMDALASGSKRNGRCNKIENKKL